MSPTTTEPSKHKSQRTVRPAGRPIVIDPLKDLRVPLRVPGKERELKVADIVGPLVIDPSENPKPRIGPEAASANRTKKTLWQQVVHGAHVAFKVVVPTWLLMWLGGFVAQKALIEVGLKPAPPVSRALDSSALQRAQVNSTSELSATIVRAQNIREGLQNGSISSVAAQKALGSTDISHQAIWQKLEPTRRLLAEYSPQLSNWFEQKATRGEVVFSGDDFEFGGERYSDYRSWNKKLTIYSSFFDLSDGQKITVIRHERSHADETWPEYVSSSLQPSVFVGAAMRAGTLLLANTSSFLSTRLAANFPTAARALDNTSQNLWQIDDPSSLASQLRYEGNRSERQAMQAELGSARDLGVEMAADQATIDSLLLHSQNPTPWQELIGLTALSAYGLAKLAQRRRQPVPKIMRSRQSLRLAGST